MLRIFLILSLAVALAGVAFSFVLKDKVGALTEQRDTFKNEKEKAIADATAARSAEKKAKDAEKKAKDELETTKTDLAAATTKLTETEGQLTKTAKELEETKVVRDKAQAENARWKAIGLSIEQVLTLKGENQNLAKQRDAFAEEKKVMGREIKRIGDELAMYKGKPTEVVLPDVRGEVTAVNPDYQFVVLNIGSESGLSPNGKLIVTRGDSLVGKVQLVKVEAKSSVANLLPEWSKEPVKAGDKVMTSYEALSK